MPNPHARLHAHTLCLAFAGGCAVAASTDAGLRRVEPGSPLVRGHEIALHDSRIEIHDVTAQGRQYVGWLTNEMAYGDSAGAAVIRFVTISETRAPDGPVSRYTLRQTFDRATLAPRGFAYVTDDGEEYVVAIDGARVRGVRRPSRWAPPDSVDVRLTQPFYMAGAIDLVLGLLPLRAGARFVLPVWSPVMPAAEKRVYVVREKTRARVGGRDVDGWLVDELPPRGGRRLSTMVVLTVPPYMEYWELPQPSGAVRRWTQELVP
jgi:hypothetical protein